MYLELKWFNRMLFRDDQILFLKKIRIMKTGFYCLKTCLSILWIWTYKIALQTRTNTIMMSKRDWNYYWKMDPIPYNRIWRIGSWKNMGKRTFYFIRTRITFRTTWNYGGTLSKCSMTTRWQDIQENWKLIILSDNITGGQGCEPLSNDMCRDVDFVNNSRYIKIPLIPPTCLLKELSLFGLLPVVQWIWSLIFLFQTDMIPYWQWWTMASQRGNYYSMQQDFDSRSMH